jgi:hypothetical protein
MGKFLDDATKDLLFWAQELSDGNAVPTVHASGSSTCKFDSQTLKEVKEKGRKSTANKRKMFNTDPFRGVRLDWSLGHFTVPCGSPKNCAFCSKSKRVTECSICGVVLCCVEGEGESSCNKDWHTQHELPV